MKRKSEAFEKFKEFRAEVENQLGKHIKVIRSDQGGEYLLRDFKNYLTEHGIISQLTAPGTPQQNVVAERRNRTLLFNFTNFFLGICLKYCNVSSEFSTFEVYS